MQNNMYNGTLAQKSTTRRSQILALKRLLRN